MREPRRGAGKARWRKYLVDAASGDGGLCRAMDVNFHTALMYSCKQQPHTINSQSGKRVQNRCASGHVQKDEHSRNGFWEEAVLEAISHCPGLWLLTPGTLQKVLQTSDPGWCALETARCSLLTGLAAWISKSPKVAPEIQTDPVQRLTTPTFSSALTPSPAPQEGCSLSASEAEDAVRGPSREGKAASNLAGWS